MGGLNYERESMSKRHADINYFNRLARMNAGEFPACKGFFPDCPEAPSLTDKNCRTCPKTDGLKKPRIGE
jgi:hypothetical protein